MASMICWEKEIEEMRVEEKKVVRVLKIETCSGEWWSKDVRVGGEPGAL